MGARDRKRERKRLQSKRMRGTKLAREMEGYDRKKERKKELKN